MNVIGITGGMGTGASTVSRYFEAEGARRIDADRIARSVIGRKDVRRRLVQRFGKEILRGRAIDRKALARAAFSDRQALRALCGITHPVIIRGIESAISRGVRRRCPVVVDAPLLIESGLYRRMDAVIVVRAPRRKRILRCLRKGYGRAEIERRMAAQCAAEKKRRHADFIIDNGGSRNETKRQVKRLWCIINKRRGT